MRPGRHGGMASSELESIIARNGNFLTVLRAGSGEGQAGLYNGITGEYYGGVGGGWIPEYSRYTKLNYDCACTQNGLCRSGAHGTNLVRGWRNIVCELLCKGVIATSKEIKRLLGDEIVYRLKDRGPAAAPMFDPNQTNSYASL